MRRADRVADSHEVLASVVCLLLLPLENAGIVRITRVRSRYVNLVTDLGDDATLVVATALVVGLLPVVASFAFGRITAPSSSAGRGSAGP